MGFNSLDGSIGSLTFARDSVAYIDGAQVSANTPGFKDVAIASGWNFSNPSHGVTPFACNGTLAVGNKFDGLYYSTDGRTWTNFANSTYNSEYLFVTDAGTVLVWTGDPTDGGVTLRRIASPTGTPAITTAQYDSGDFSLSEGVGLQRQWAWQEGDTICLLTYPLAATEGDECEVYRSTDDGATWDLVHTQAQTVVGSNNHGHAICYMRDKSWWMASIGDGANATRIYSTDDGENWANLYDVNTRGSQPVLMIPLNDGSSELLCGADLVNGFYTESYAGYTPGERVPMDVADLGWPTHVIDGTSAATARFCWGGIVTSANIVVAGHSDNTITDDEDAVGKRVISVSPLGSDVWASPVHLPSDSAGIRTIFEINGFLFGSEGYDNSNAYNYRPFELTHGSVSARQGLVVARPIAAANIKYTSAQTSEPTSGWSNFTGDGSTITYPTSGGYSGSRHVSHAYTPTVEKNNIALAILAPNFTADASAKYVITGAVRGQAQMATLQMYFRYNNANPDVLMEFVPMADNWLFFCTKPYTAADALPLRAGFKAPIVNPLAADLANLIEVDAVNVVESDNPVEFMDGQVARAGEATSDTFTPLPNRRWTVSMAMLSLYDSYKMSGNHTLLDIESGTDAIKLVYDADNEQFTLSNGSDSDSTATGKFLNQWSQVGVTIEVSPIDDTITATFTDALAGETLTIGTVSADMQDGSEITAHFGDSDVTSNMGMVVANALTQPYASGGGSTNYTRPGLGLGVL